MTYTHNGAEVGFPPRFFVFLYTFVQVAQIKKVTGPKFRFRQEAGFGPVSADTKRRSGESDRAAGACAGGKAS